jgi:single-strand DNA-binding protein
LHSLHLAGLTGAQEIQKMSYLNSITLVGFVGSDPQQRQAKGNGSKFTVLSVATQRSWKNAEDEWASKTEWHRVCVFRPRLAEYVSTTIKKGSHVLVEGSLVSTTYERGNGKGKKAKTNKQTFWCIRADVVRKLDRGEPEPETVASGSAASSVAAHDRGASAPSPVLAAHQSATLT